MNRSSSHPHPTKKSGRISYGLNAYTAASNVNMIFFIMECQGYSTEICNIKLVKCIRAVLAECQDAPAGKYCVVVDVDEINGDFVFDGTVVAEAATAPDPAAAAVDACLGYLTGYPDTEAEIARDN